MNKNMNKTVSKMDGDNVFILYSTSGCHLCEQALAILDELKYLGAEQGVSWQLKIIDIAEDVVLFDCFGIRIPVLAFQGNDRELGWPFDTQTAQAFIQSSIKS